MFTQLKKSAPLIIYHISDCPLWYTTQSQHSKNKIYFDRPFYSVLPAPCLCFVFLQHHQNSALWPFLETPQFTGPVVGGSSFQGQECLNSRRECGKRGHPDYGHHVVMTCNLFNLAGFLSANSHLKQPVSEQSLSKHQRGAKERQRSRQPVDN